MVIAGGSGRTPHYMRWMVFVDGTNFLIELSKEFNIKFRADRPPLESLMLSSLLINSISNEKLGIGKVRAYWFSSYQGNDEDYNRVARELRKRDFEPVLFKKRKGKEKGVDIGLAKEMLVNAFNQNFDIGLMIAGDEDYVGLIHEVKRYGAIIRGAFFNHGLSEKLQLEFDQYYDIIRDNPICQRNEFRDSLEELKKSCNNGEYRNS